MFIDLLRKRRSIRQFTDTPVEKKNLDLLIESLLRSPSSRSLNPWEFVVVTDRDDIHKLSMAKPHGASFMKGAPLAVVVCADPEKSDVWVEDCSIAAHNIHLAAADLGLGSCWVQIRKRQYDETTSSEHYVGKILGLPETMRVEAVVAIGYPKEKKPGRKSQDLPFDRISYQRFGNRSPLDQG